MRDDYRFTECIQARPVTHFTHFFQMDPSSRTSDPPVSQENVSDDQLRPLPKLVGKVGKHCSFASGSEFPHFTHFFRGQR